MGVYVIRRLIWLPFLVIIVTFITFAMLRLGPGDPVQIWLGQHQNDQVRERIRAKLGLDDPLFIQYARYMEGVITRLDFGESFKFRGKSVREVIGTRILVSMQLNLAAIIITLGIGIPVGLLAALRQGTGWDNLIVSIALAFQSLPVFITAPVMLLVFALHLDVLPTSGWGGFFSPKIVMPAIVMGVMIVPMVSSLSEDAMRAVPISLREGAYALGATKVEVATKVVVPASLSGIVAAFILGMSRAVGETMIVFIAAGQNEKLTFNPLDPVNTMTGFMATTNFSDNAIPGTGQFQALFAVGITLFVITLLMNLLSQFVVARFREVYE